MPEESGIPQALPDDETAALSDRGAAAVLRAQPKARHAALRLLTGVQAGLTHVLRGDAVEVGRGSTCGFVIDDGALSRRHCRITRAPGGTFIIEDLESRNGTQIDGLRIEGPRPLRDGALIELAAGTTLKFSIKDDLELEAERKLYESAVLDPLTGLHNRRHLDGRLRAEVAFAARHGTPLSVLIIDVDHFKKINDTQGHAAGDTALRALAERLTRSVRVEDVVARYGGEEFAVLARGIGTAGAMLLAERIRETVAAMRTQHEAITLAFTISVGVTTMDAERRFPTVEALLKAADDALYAAKGSGRNRCVRG